MKILILLLAASSVLSAGQTRTWTQGEAADFEKGILKNLSLRSDGRLTLAPLSRELFDTSSSLPVGAGAGFQGQPLCRRRHQRQAVPHSAGRQGQTAGRPGRAGDPRDRRGQPRPRLCGDIAGRQDLSHHGQRQAGSVLRSQGEIHLGAGLRCGGQSVRRHGRPGRTASRDPGRQGQRVFQDGRDARTVARDRRQGQPDRWAPNRAAWCCASHRRAMDSCCTRCRSAR